MVDIPIETWLQQSDKRIVDARQGHSSAANDDVLQPIVTISYAQSIDGSIAARRGEATLLSGPESLQLAHRLRAAHDAILVGIGTILSDDPQLTVRLASGRSPRPIILDSNANTPITARLMQAARSAVPLIFCAKETPLERRRILQEAGAEVICCERNDAPGGGVGLGVSLEEVLSQLAAHGVRRLMVEGGARVISAFLTQGMADRAVITVAPCWLGGLSVFESAEPPAGKGVFRPTLRHFAAAPVGADIAIWGELAR